MTTADQHLLELIRLGDSDGWSQFVERYQTRLLAWCELQVDQRATAEDLLQETLIGFLQALPEQSVIDSVEAMLFRILRRRIVDHYRKQGRQREISVCRLQPSQASAADEPSMNQFPSQDLHASAWARRQEQNGQMRQALQQAIDQLTRTLQSAGKFRDLKIAEGLFYAGCRNQQLAGLLQVPENEVGIVKHRLLQRLQQSVRENGGGELCGDTKSATSLLTEVWEERRPGCPKRSTLGRFQLGLLEPDWDDFVQFHVQTLGCTFCVAHLQELDESNSSQADSDIRQRLFQSTVGFLTPKRSAPRC